MSHSDKFSPIDEWSHLYSPAKFLTMARQLANLSEECEATAALRTCLDNLGVALDEVQTLRKRSGFRGINDTTIAEHRAELYREATGKCWRFDLDKAREAGL